VLEGTALDAATEVLVDKLSATFIVLSPTRLEVVIPDGTSKGKVEVITTHGSATAKAKFVATFSIESFKPVSAAPGKEVTIKGVGFNSSSTVSFDGTPATVTSESSTKLKVVIPAGASTGPLRITNTAAPLGTVSSAQSFTP
jgi:hypothetical protein